MPVYQQGECQRVCCVTEGESILLTLRTVTRREGGPNFPPKKQCYVTIEWSLGALPLYPDPQLSFQHCFVKTCGLTKFWIYHWTWYLLIFVNLKAIKSKWKGGNIQRARYIFYDNPRHTKNNWELLTVRNVIALANIYVTVFLLTKRFDYIFL